MVRDFFSGNWPNRSWASWPVAASERDGGGAKVRSARTLDAATKTYPPTMWGAKKNVPATTSGGTNGGQDLGLQRGGEGHELARCLTGRRTGVVQKHVATNIAIILSHTSRLGFYPNSNRPDKNKYFWSVYIGSLEMGSVRTTPTPWPDREAS
jgi:hypothetical protein